VLNITKLPPGRQVSLAYLMITSLIFVMSGGDWPFVFLFFGLPAFLLVNLSIMLFPILLDEPVLEVTAVAVLWVGNAYVMGYFLRALYLFGCMLFSPKLEDSQEELPETDIQ
jgi:hypothetical protein